MPDPILEANNPVGIAERIQSTLRCLGAILIGSVLLVGVASLQSIAQAQVQIEQVEPVSSQIEGTTQGQVIVTTKGECKPSSATCEGVSRTDVLDLIPSSTPPLQTASGNSAVVFQEGNQNDASVTQRGQKNEASAAQQGDDNNVSVVQSGLGSGGEGEGLLSPPFSSFPDVPADEAFDNARGVLFQGLNGPIRGEGNLAVAVQKGTSNDTNIEQRGRDNVAGIRLNGSDNEANLAQMGVENQYLLDYTGSDLSLNVAQIGNQNHLTQIGNGQKPFDVTMRGNGMRMIIQHNAP